MKKIILASMAALALSAYGQTPSETNVIVEQTDGEKTVYAASDIKAMVFEEMPDYVSLDELIQAIYTPVQNYGMYELVLANAIPDVSGNPVKVGDISVLTTLTAPLSDDRRNAILPDGYYRLGNGTQNFTFDVSKTAIYVRTAEGADGVSVTPCISGTIDVRYADGKYDIRLELVAFDGTIYNLSYEGAIPFLLSSTGYEGFSEDIDINFEGCQGRFYGNWTQPFADDLTLQLYTGDFNVNGHQISGYWFNIPMNMPKVDNPMNPEQKLADGVYTMDHRVNVAYNTYLPFTCEQGQVSEEFGMMMVRGSALSYTDPMGDNRLGLAVSGTLTVSEDGTKIVVDFYTEDGVRIGGTFDGAPDIINFCDNDKTEPDRPYSTVEGNVALNFLPNTVGLYYKDSDIVPGLSTYTLWITDIGMEEGDYLQFMYIAKEGGPMTNGTYTVALPSKAGDVLPGSVNFAGLPVFSWYGVLDSVDDEGYQTILGPIDSGTFTISDSQKEGYKKFSFNLKDDKGNAITGSADIPVIDVDDFPTDAPARKLNRR